MKRILITLILLLPMAAVGQTLQPNGWGWQEISDSRRQGFVEGFDFRSGLSLQMGTFNQNAAMKDTCKHEPATTMCALHQLEDKTLVDLPSDKTMTMVSAFYGQPQNLPVRWDHAVVIAEAMVSGVVIPEKLLEQLRQEDAARTK